MAKRRSKSQARRDPIAIARPNRLLSPVRILRPSALPIRLARVQLRDFDDRRRWHPEPFHRPPVAFQRPAARLVATNPPDRPKRFVPASVGFKDPSRVSLCVRRRSRREVLFATGSGGRPRRYHNKPRRNELSNYSCR